MSFKSVQTELHAESRFMQEVTVGCGRADSRAWDGLHDPLRVLPHPISHSLDRRGAAHSSPNDLTVQRGDWAY